MATTIQELFDEEGEEPVMSAEDQVAELLELAKVFKEAIEIDASTCCPKCGYIEPCKSDKACEAHNEAFIIANRQLNSTLSKSSFWYMWVHCNVPIVDRRFMLAIRSKIAPVH